MANRVQVPKGLNSLPLSQVPSKWDPIWFAKFLQTWLGPADIRNATGNGISISGSGKQAATLSTQGYTGSVTISGTKLNFQNGLLVSVG